MQKLKCLKVSFLACFGIYKDSNNNKISKIEAITRLKNVGKCFAKPTVDSCSGQGCRLLNIISGTDKESNKSIEEILDLLGDNFVIQECIKCSESISRIYPKSVNTFRIITYRWKDEIINMPAIMRIGRNGNYLDNAHAGGIFIAIDDDGKLHEKAFTEFKEEYEKHPDSRIVFNDYNIENFEKVINSAKTMHNAIPQIGVVNWDFTINENGIPVLIEANINGGSIWLIEMAHGKGAFGDNTKEVLKWLRLMKNSSVEKRKKYSFGNISI